MILDISQKVYIYGSGEFAQRIKNNLAKLHIEIISFLEFDESRLRPGTLNPLLILDKENTTVIIGLGNFEADIKNISTRLGLLNFNLIQPVEIAQLFHSNGITFENYWLTGDVQIFDKNRNSIDSARSYLTDKKSKSLYDEIINFRKTSSLESLPDPESMNMVYMPDDLPWVIKDNPLNVIDCGAYVGDTLKAFTKNNFQLKNYFAFEPDTSNFEKLYHNVNLWELENIFCFNNATWSENTILSFTFGGGEDNTGAHVTQLVTSHNQKVLALRLDSIFSDIKIDLIKMDIEGAEINTLLGLKNVIQKDLPFLAISVYHKPEDLWEIPLLIHSFSKEYNLYLRNYGQQTFETVLYCVPK
jgi:FkbM family methyltransferase